MSEQTKTITPEEFVNQQKQKYHDATIQFKTMAEQTKDTNVVVNAASVYSFVAGIYDEIESIYTILNLMMGDDKFAIGLSKAILGFSKPTHVEEIEARAKEIGEFSTILISKKIEWELEEKEKEKYK